MALLALYRIIKEVSKPYEVSFIVFGDYGRDGLYNQKETAAAMERFCWSHKCDFAITTGDNMYSDGVDSPDDPQFKNKF